MDLNGSRPDEAPDMYTIASVARLKLRHDATLFVSGAGPESELIAYLSDLFAVLGPTLASRELWGHSLSV